MDSFFGIGLFELVMIAVVALLVLGPERLPAAMREVAKWMRQVRNLSSEFQSQFSEEFKMLDEMNPRRIINEVIDPNAQTKPTSGQAGKQAPGQPAAKPPVPKPVTPPASKPAPAKPAPAALPAAIPAITNGETQNTILPPTKAPTEADAPAESVLPVAPPTAGDLPAEPAATDVPLDGQEQEAAQ